MRVLHFILFIVFWIVLVPADAQDSKCTRSTEGMDFWFGFMEGRNDNQNVHYIEITVTASQATGFNIYIGKSQTPYFEGFVNSNSSALIRIPLELGEATGSETVQEKGIRLTSDLPVNVYALNWDRNSADVAVIYPTTSLGKQYFTMCYKPRIDQDPGHGRNSEFLIVASEDNTLVKITPSVVTDRGRAPGVTFPITLNKGEVYQVQSANQRNLDGQGDLTGSYIESDKPVAVYSGNFATTIPAESGEGGYDHLFEQMPPLHTWGRQYYAVPLKPRQADRYRILASEDNTTVRYRNNIVELNRGEYHEFTLGFNEASQIQADKPVLVAQFSQSKSTDNNFTGGLGDPFMIILSPISQTKNSATFELYTSGQIEKYYINIVVLTSEIKNLLLDEATIGPNLFRPFPGTDYSYAQIETTFPGTHTLYNINPEQGFLAYVYAYGGWESYGYGVGFNLDLVLDLGFEEDTVPLCNGESIELNAGPFFDIYRWNTGDTTQKITVTETGWYKAVGSTIDGCTQSDSVFMLVSNPDKPSIGEDLFECEPFSTELNAGNGYAKYEWNTGDSTQTISIDKTGTYSVKTFDDWGCFKSDTLSLTVYPVPKISFEENSLVCGTKSRTVSLSFEGADDNMLQNGKMEWNTNSPNLSLSNKTNQSVNVQVSEFGEYELFYLFTTPDNCIIPDTLQLRFAPVPTSGINFAGENPDDKCGDYNREIIYTGDASPNASYYWDFGGSWSDSLDWNRYLVSLAIQNSVTTVKLVVEEFGCWSDTSFLEIGANPDFIMNTSESRGCDSAFVNFSGEFKTPGQHLFEWDFGDGSQISNLQNPGHFYADTGKYNVSLKITNQASGCQIGYTINEMVKIYPTPEVDIVVDPDFCNDKTVEVFYLQNKDSSFCFWEFEGASQIGPGNDSILLNLENEIATIRLQVEEYGCLSSWKESSAKRKPLLDIGTENEHGCQPLEAVLMAISADEIQEYFWLTDSMVYSGAEQTFYLPDARNYDFKLAGTSALTGCSDTIIKNDFIRVHPKPFATFEVDYPVAILEHANLQFTNNTEDVEYLNWNFGDGTTSEEENPQHTFTSLGSFPVQLTVESEFGCADSSTLDINIIPFNVFTPNAFRPDSEIPENREFMPVGEGVDPSGFVFRIYNRWGDLIFESKSPENKWDGTINNSNQAPMGNYVWQADFYDIQGFKHSMKGQVLLIR